MPYLVDIHQSLLQIGARIVASQSDIDALATAVDALTSQIVADDAQLNTAVSGIAAEIAALKSANPAVDVSALQAKVTAAQSAVADLGTAATAVSGLVPPAAPAA